MSAFYSAHSSHIGRVTLHTPSYAHGHLWVEGCSSLSKDGELTEKPLPRQKALEG